MRNLMEGLDRIIHSVLERQATLGRRLTPEEVNEIVNEEEFGMTAPFRPPRDTDVTTRDRPVAPEIPIDQMEPLPLPESMDELLSLKAEADRTGLTILGEV